MLNIKLIGLISNSFWSHFATSYSINQGKLLISQYDISHVKLVSDSPPPIFVLWLMNKLFQLTNCRFLILKYRLQFIIIAKIFKLIIPSIWNFSNFDFSQLVLLIIRIIFVLWNLSWLCSLWTIPFFWLNLWLHQQLIYYYLLNYFSIFIFKIENYPPFDFYKFQSKDNKYCSKYNTITATFLFSLFFLRNLVG